MRARRKTENGSAPGARAGFSNCQPTPLSIEKMNDWYECSNVREVVFPEVIGLFDNRFWGSLNLPASVIEWYMTSLLLNCGSYTSSRIDSPPDVRS
jgi:hypothetical protein